MILSKYLIQFGMTIVYIALKETNETMDRELNNLKYENDRLEIEVKKLEASVSHLKDMEHTLATLRNMERISLDDLQTQLHQSQEILNQLEVCSRFLSLYILYTCRPCQNHHPIFLCSFSYFIHRSVWSGSPYKVSF